MASVDTLITVSVSDLPASKILVEELVRLAAMYRDAADGIDRALTAYRAALAPSGQVDAGL